MLKVILIALLLAMPSSALRAEDKAAAPSAEITLVQSVPEETVYGSKLAARPQEVWLDMIGAAEKTLDFEQFYIADQKDEALEPVLEAIVEAARRGVKVRFIVDSVMMKESGKSLPALEKAGVKTRVVDFRKAIGGVQHAKFFIVDGKDVFVGSQNFDWRALTQIHEVGVRIKSEKAAADLKLLFEADWALAGGRSVKKMFSKKKVAITRAKPEKALMSGKEVSYSLAYSPSKYVPRRADTEEEQLLGLLASAEKTVRVQVMNYALSGYGSPRWARLDSAIRKAAARGVEVQLIFADWTMGKKGDRDIKALAKTDNISVRIASLPEHSRGFIPYSRVDHAKYMIVDGETAYVTTSNWAPSYFHTSRGVAVIIEGSAAGQALEDIFRAAWEGPYVKPVDPLKEYEKVKRS